MRLVLYSLLGGLSFYQVVAWNGISYVTLVYAEAGKGYWVLVLEDAIIDILIIFLLFPLKRQCSLFCK
jgi:hypothetical protein